MATVVKVHQVVKGLSRGGEPYTRTYALVESRRFGLVEVYGYGSDFTVGDAVMIFFHDPYNGAKMIRIR